MSHDLVPHDLLGDLPEPVEVRSRFGGVQAIWRFPNGRGASVIRHGGSYGTELAVLRFYSEAVEGFDLDYSTPLTNDVIGDIAGPSELVGLLRQIRDLPPVGVEGLGRPTGSGSPDGLPGVLNSFGRMLGSGS